MKPRSIRTIPGKRDEVVAILLADVAALKHVGCQVYAVSLDREVPELIWVYEVWDDEASHKPSLQLPTTRAAIAQAMPLLTGEFTAVETTVAGGLGV